VLVCSSVAADALPEHVQVGVIMPKLKKPYKIVFDDISNGLFDVLGNLQLNYISMQTLSERI